MRLVLSVALFAMFSTPAFAELRTVNFGGAITNTREDWVTPAFLQVGDTFSGQYVIDVDTPPDPKDLGGPVYYYNAVRSIELTFKSAQGQVIASNKFEAKDVLPSSSYVGMYDNTYNGFDSWTVMVAGLADSEWAGTALPGTRISLHASNGNRESFSGTTLNDLPDLRKYSLNTAFRGLLLYTYEGGYNVLAIAQLNYVYFADSPIPGVPEPSTYAMFALGAGCLALLKRRRCS